MNLFGKCVPRVAGWRPDDAAAGGELPPSAEGLGGAAAEVQGRPAGQVRRFRKKIENKWNNSYYLNFRQAAAAAAQAAQESSSSSGEREAGAPGAAEDSQQQQQQQQSWQY